MRALISMLRGVNVGGHHMIPMGALRELYESLGLRDAQTYIQSGNVVFASGERDLDRVSERIGAAIEKAYGFRPGVMLRTSSELKDVIAGNPFAARPGIDPRKLIVMFLAGDPGADARRKILEIKADPEELRAGARHLYVYFPNGMGSSKLSMALVEKTLKAPATARNWNTVAKLLAMAEQMEESL